MKKESDAMLVGTEFKTAHELFVEQCESQGICPDCGGAIKIRNPTGKCDHLQYPEYKKENDPSDPSWGKRSKTWSEKDYRDEWHCEHGIGHGNHAHGCDGCCRGDNYPGKKERK